MTQSKIRWIIGFMTLALVGLIAFQAYWLGFMLETKKNNSPPMFRMGWLKWSEN